MTLSIFHRTWIMCACIILLCVQTPDWAYIPNILAQIILFGFCALTILNHENDGFRLNYISLISGLFMVYCFAGLIWSDIVFFSLQNIGTYMFLPSLLLSFHCIKDDLVSMDTVYKTLVVFSVLLCAGAIYQFYAGAGRYGDVANHPFGNPNSLAIFIGLGGLTSLYYGFCSSSTRSKIICGLVYVLCFVCVAMTESRAVVLMMAFMPLLIGAHQFQIRKSKFPSRRTLSLIAVVMVILMVIFAQYIPSIMGPRWPIWMGAWDTILQSNPIFGTGIGTFRDVYLMHRLDGDPSAGLHAHNDFLHLWIEIGLVGVALILSIFVIVLPKFIGIIQGRNLETSLPIYLLLFLLVMATVTPVFIQPPMVILLGIFLIEIIKTQKSRVVKSLWPIQFLVLSLIVLGIISLQNFANSYAMANIKHTIAQGDLIAFVESADAVDMVSLNTNPATPIFRASTLLAMYKSNLVEQNKKDQVVAEVSRYLDDAQIRNPYNPEILYYHGMNMILKGDKKQAMSYWRQALDIDPRYFNARMRLAENTDDQSEAYAILKPGIYFKYWKNNPREFYITSLKYAIDFEDSRAQEVLEYKIAKQLRLK